MTQTPTHLRSPAAPTPPHPAPSSLPQEEVKAATQELERLIEEGVFERADCGLLHGQMAPVDKEAVLARFKAGDLKLLVR